MIAAGADSSCTEMKEQMLEVEHHQHELADSAGQTRAKAGFRMT